MSSAQFRFGARDAAQAARKAAKEEQEYDMILEDEIEFIQALQMPGNKDKKVSLFLPLILYTTTICHIGNTGYH
jgi:hypothetical protein